MKPNNKSNQWPSTLGRVLLFWLGSIVVFAASSALTKQLPTDWAPVLAIIIALIGSLLLTILFARWEGLQLKDAGLLPGNKSIFRVLAGFTIGSLLAFLQAMLVLVTGHITLAWSPQISFSTLISNLLLYVLVACREEVAFRGFPLQSLNKIAGRWKALLITTGLFIIEHKMGGMSWPQAILGPGAGAILFGLAALKTKGLALPVGLHTAWNVGQWLLGFKNGTGWYKAVIEKGYEARTEHAGWISYLLVMGLAILSFYYWKRNTEQRSGEIA
ncbi:MAG: family intrarane metalloprotease [Mucilaginibacter sp.]|nr:family intrarane metalloprotease [Mucilaginibacter sp.]